MSYLIEQNILFNDISFKKWLLLNYEISPVKIN
jgi:hypothetical protein